MERALDKAREEALQCRACDLWRSATQTVFGEGLRSAEMMLVGEQPGDQEDRSGRPFVGPAGRLLDQALEAAEIPRKRIYLTNAVKHFKWQPRGKLRIHKKPNAKEVAACRPWLEREIALVRPWGLLCLGATAARALLGAGIRVTTARGRALESPVAPLVMVTVHPSSLLRAPSESEREQGFARFVADLRTFARLSAQLVEAEREHPRARRRARVVDSHRRSSTR